MLSLPFVLLAVTAVRAALTSSSLEKYTDVLDLDYSFGPVKEAYWTGYPHHRRTPFAVSSDGSTAYLAYLDSSETDVHVQQVDPTTFTAVGTAVTISGAKEAGGLVAHSDGFALLTNEALPSGTTDAPADSTPVPVLYRYTDGEQTFKTFLGGPGVHASDGLSASPDLNGDLVYSEKAGLYGAYFVVTDYTGDASGHYGDSIQYVNTIGELQTITGATSSWGCSHNTGIAFEAADEAPFASICAEDQGAIWLNTNGQGMTTVGVKISNENTTNGASNEPMGGMSGSYSGLARFIDSDRYIFTWVSRGAIDLTLNEWMGEGYTHSLNRTNNRNVAVAVFSNKTTLDGEEATSEVGAASGDDQVNWLTQGTNDCSNAHVAVFDDASALVTWEEIADPICDYIAMGCRGAFAGTKFQQVDSAGNAVGDPLTASDVYVAGDMVTMSDGRICWPYVNMTWTLDEAVAYGGSTATTTKMSFACMSVSSNGTTTASTTTTATTAEASASAVQATLASTTAAAAATSPIAEEAEAATSSTPAAAVTPSSSSSSSAAAAVVAQPLTSAAAQPVTTTLSTAASRPTSTQAAEAIIPSSFATEQPDVPTATSAAIVPVTSADVLPSFSLETATASASATPGEGDAFGWRPCRGHRGRRWGWCWGRV